ncbi:hypothetical protein GC088_08810 [Arthrobacter sp. JZ12]|uniref:hypothetical protein n=1 Tax=Arthrobacter sp. JZ12 TaxID=2654190 RepID=UPI002B474B8B|nr:hypothetical protein [Arthrobacter sp. JZ12]WRH25151.1 hypothetical protein GC088_08810 [Arthrobacter sp. JZ12]
MDAQSPLRMMPALDSGPLLEAELALDLDQDFDYDDDFPSDLSAETACRLTELCDSLFIELDSDSPDLRAMERYQAVCDELSLRHIASGVA